MIKAYGKNIIVKQLELENKKSILLHLKQENHNWEVLSVGKNVEAINKGEIIFISPYGISKLDGEDGLFVTQEDHVLAKKDV